MLRSTLNMVVKFSSLPARITELNLIRSVSSENFTTLLLEVVQLLRCILPSNDLTAVHGLDRETELEFEILEPGREWNSTSL